MTQSTSFGIIPGKRSAKLDWIAYCIGIILLVRLLLVGWMGPMPQDAYYYMYAEYPALSYYDHPPMVGYMLKVFVFLFGKSVFVLKLANTVVAGFTICFFFLLARRILGFQKARNATVLLFSTVMVTILSLVTMPDNPLLLFWTLTLLALYMAIFEEKKAAWLFAGLWMGLAFDSKYIAIFLLIGLIFFLLFSKEHRRKILSPWFGLMLIIFLVVISPVIYWNVQHDFASLKFQSSARTDSMQGLQLKPKYFLGTLGHELGLLLPVLFISFIYFLVKIIKKYKLSIQRIPSATLFLLSFFLPVFAGFLFLSLFYWVKLNWMMPAYIAGIIWVGRYFSQKWIRIQLVCSLVAHLAFAYVIIFYPVPIRSDDTWYGWKELSSKVKELQESEPGSFVFSDDGNKTSAALNFYMPGKVYAGNIVGKKALQFDYIGTVLDSLEGRTAYFVNSSPRFKDELKENDMSPAFRTYFETVTELEPILIKKNNKIVRKFLVFRCTNYQPGSKGIYSPIY